VQVELLGMLDHDRYGLAAGYATASLMAGYLAVYAATAMVRRVRIVL
jgi:CrcB protein